MSVTETINTLIATVNDNITTNGNNEITGQKHRAVLTAILQSLEILLNQPTDYILAQFEDYDPLETYVGGVQKIVVFESELWIFIDDTDKTGVTPGTLPTAWAPFSMLELAHPQNTDKRLADGTSNQVSAAELRQLLDEFSTSVLGVVLTGYTVGSNAALAATDTILEAFGKLQAQINAGGGGGGVSSVNALTGAVILALETLDDVPAYPDDGFAYYLSEEDGVLTWELVAGTPTEEEIEGTAIYNATMTGTVNLDLATFTAYYGILTGATTITVSNTPASGESFVRSLKIKSTTTEALTLPVAWEIVGEYTADGTLNDLQIEFTNFPTEGLVVTCYINALS